MIYIDTQHCQMHYDEIQNPIGSGQGIHDSIITRNVF